MLFSSALQFSELLKSLQVAGKRPGGLPIVAASSLPTPFDSCLLTICDTAYGHRFLVDTNAQISVVPVSPHDRSIPAPHTAPSHLCYANSSSIKVHFITDSTLHLADRKYSAHLHAEASFPLLGTNFLSQHHLLVEVKNHHLVNG